MQVEGKDQITEDIILSQTISNKIHHWIGFGNDLKKLDNYAYGMDRVAEISHIVRETITEVRQKISEIPKLAYWRVNFFNKNRGLIYSEDNILMQRFPRDWDQSDISFFQVMDSSICHLDTEDLINLAQTVKYVTFELINLKHIETDPVVVKWELSDVVLKLESTKYPHLTEYNMLHWSVNYKEQKITDHYRIRKNQEHDERKKRNEQSSGY